MTDAFLDQPCSSPGGADRNGQRPGMNTGLHDLESRTRLLDLPIGKIDDLCREGAHSEAGPEGFSHDFQICLPYRGLFVWHVAGEDVVGDPNQIVFVRSGEPFRMRDPLAEGYAELIITPDVEVLSEIAHIPGEHLAQHPLFKRRSWRAQPGFQSFGARLRQWAVAGSLKDTLEAEELVLALLRAALRPDGHRQTPNGTRTASLVRRTKEFLEAHLATRILLADIAREVRASPAYLTDLFTRVEGISLHHYLTQLRLARALAELPDADDLTGLALDLGFSSHSHFTFAFRRAFGCTPSDFRDAARRAAPPVAIRRRSDSRA